MAKAVQRVKKKEKKNITAGVAHVDSSFNNTRITITDAQGNTVSWSTAGAQGFKGSRKSTPFAAQLVAENAAKTAQAQLDSYEKNVSIMQRAYEMTLSAYNAGSRDLLALQTAVDNLATAKNTLQNQRFTIISAILDLENTLGVPFGTLGQKE